MEQSGKCFLTAWKSHSTKLHVPCGFDFSYVHVSSPIHSCFRAYQSFYLFTFTCFTLFTAKKRVQSCTNFFFFLLFHVLYPPQMVLLCLSFALVHLDLFDFRMDLVPYKSYSTIMKYCTHELKHLFI